MTAAEVNAVMMILHLLLSLKSLSTSVGHTLELIPAVHLSNVISDLFSGLELAETYLARLYMPLDATLIAEVRTAKFA